MNTQTKLADYPVAHAGRRKIMHPDLKLGIHAQTAVRYLRFPGKAKIDYLE